MEQTERGRGRLLDRRQALKLAAAGAVVGTFAGYYQLVKAGDRETREARSQKRADGRPRLPPGQFLLKTMREMGGLVGDTEPANFTLTVHGEVNKPLRIDFAALLKLPQVDQVCDVHCVTAWSVFDVEWRGVPVAHLAELAGMKETARHVIFEAAFGYTANVLIEEALAPTSLVAHRLFGDPVPVPHGAPVRALVPDLYFWKSAKWLTGIRFAAQDEPGFWETRGYNNHADPWREERYA